MCGNGVTCATAFQPEADDRKGERNAVNLLGLGVNFSDSLQCFALHFSHGYTVAPCTVSSREKIKKVRQAKFFNSRADLDLARRLLKQISCQESYKQGGTPSPQGETLIITQTPGARQAFKNIYFHVFRELGTILVAQPRSSSKKK